MESKSVGFCILVAGLGIISAATGFAAEVTRVKASDVHIEGGYCFYPSSPALALGIVAAAFAVVTRIYITVMFCGSGCCHSTLISKLLYILSWVNSVIAAVLLLADVGIINEAGGEFDSYGYVTCYVVKPGIYAFGAVFALLSAFFEIFAFVTLISSTQNTISPPGAAPEVDLEKSSN